MDRRTYQVAGCLLVLLGLQTAVAAKVLGAIVPHHLLAEPMIASALAGLEPDDYDTIIILSPNHWNAGPHLISTTADVKKALGLKEAGVDENSLSQEHGIFSLLPLIKKTFPRARVLPIMFKYYVEAGQAGRLAERLARVADDRTLVIASVDFSHKATAGKALANDRKSIKTISTFDLGKVYSLALDSRPSIYCLLTYLKQKKTDHAIFLGNANAADFTAEAKPDDLTSYVTFYFETEDRLVTLLATGDVMLGRAVNLRLMSLDDYAFPFRALADKLKAVDISLINLEGPLVKNVLPTNEGFKITASEKAVAGLKLAGVDVVNLANNHILDQGEEGLLNTTRVLREQAIQYCDAASIAVKEVKGTKFAFVGFNFLSPAQKMAEAAAQIQKAKALADVVVVSVHFGDEYSRYPNTGQRAIARQLVEAGADLIIGNHPHYVQGTEIYNGKLIAYSHGNFIFDQVWSEETKTGVVGEYTFYKKKLTGFSFWPIEIKNLCQPQPADEQLSKTILERIAESTLIPR